MRLPESLPAALAPGPLRRGIWSSRHTSLGQRCLTPTERGHMDVADGSGGRFAPRLSSLFDAEREATLHVVGCCMPWTSSPALHSARQNDLRSR
jgi:hypothetical protein